MKIRVVFTLFVLVFMFVNSTSSIAIEKKVSKDIVLKAMLDELKRTSTKLKLPEHKPPYFCQFNLYENDDFSVEATLGSVTSTSRERQRTYSPIIRVGDYDFDNTNFHKGFVGQDSSYEQLAPITNAPLDDDYFAIRKTFWINSDFNYKRAVDKFEEKKAYILERAREEKLPDFCKVKKLRYLKPRLKLAIDKERWTNRVKKLSSLFAKYPQIRNSWVRFDERIINTWLVNTEGTIVRNAERAVRILSYANVQAKDGSVFTDGRVFLAHSRDNLPTYDAMEKELNKLAQSLIERTKAEKLDYYEGPVLFKGQAAAQLFGRVMAPYLIGHRKELGNTYYNDSFDRLARRMGRRVMPLFLSVVDDPFAKTFNKKPLFGGFDIDDEGVLPERLTLIKDGYLKTLCSGRTPTKEIKVSNGHGSLQSQTGTSKYSVLFVNSSKTVREDEMLSKLKELGKKAKLDYVVVVERLANSVRDGSLFETVDSQQIEFGPMEGQLTAPIVFYKLSLKDGKKTQLRGGKFGPVTARILKDIVCVGNDADAYAVEDQSNNYYHLISPSLLVSEVEIEKKENVSKPPLIPNPLKEKSKD